MTGKEKKQADALKIVFEVRLLVNYCAERTLITPRHTTVLLECNFREGLLHCSIG